VMPYEVDQSLPHFRHFKIINHNKTYGGNKWKMLYWYSLYFLMNGKRTKENV
jgi:hypothetical protein